MNVKEILQKYNLHPDMEKDQYFLLDNNILQQIVGLADLNRKDIVLEIGAGVGNLTEKLSQKAGTVIAFEIDLRFKPILEELPKNVAVHYENALDFIQLQGKSWQFKEYNKIVSNLPYSFCEPFLHNLTFLKYDKAILLIPQKFANKIASNPVFGAFFEVKLKFKVDKSKFYPQPSTNSVVIDLIHLPSPTKTRNLSLFLRQYLYQHEAQKVKNALREGLIEYAQLVHNKKVTKNQARSILDNIDIDPELLNKYPDNPEIYQEVGKKFSSVSVSEALG